MAEHTHPQEKNDRVIVESLLRSPVTDYNLLELARLRIRYKNFPGALQLQKDMDRVLQQWYLSEAELFEKTRALYATDQVREVYRKKIQNNEEKEDWN